MKLLRAIAGVVLTVGAVLFGAAPSHTQATPNPVVIVHGWDAFNQGQVLWNQVYGGLANALTQDGYPVYGPILPANGSMAGDSIINANELKQYIEDNELDNVTLVCHSLGGTVCEYYVRYLDEGEISQYVLLDSNITTTGVTGFFGCLVNPPDQCAGSMVRNAIFAASARNDLYLTNVWSTYYGSQLQIDCRRYVYDTHKGMASNPATIGYVEQVLANNSC